MALPSRAGVVAEQVRRIELANKIDILGVLVNLPMLDHAQLTHQRVVIACRFRGPGEAGTYHMTDEEGDEYGAGPAQAAPGEAAHAARPGRSRQGLGFHRQPLER